MLFSVAEFQVLYETFPRVHLNKLMPPPQLINFGSFLKLPSLKKIDVYIGIYGGGNNLVPDQSILLDCLLYWFLKKELCFDVCIYNLYGLLALF